MTAKRAASRGKVLHFDGAHKPHENSPAGVRLAAKRGQGIDLDSCETAPDPKTGIPTEANTHYPNLREFLYTKASERVAHRLGIKGVVAGHQVNKQIGTLPWALVATVRSKVGGYPIRSMAAQIKLAGELDVSPLEHEPKQVPSVEAFRRFFAAAARAYGPTWRRHYIVKRLWSLRGAKQCLENAHTADPDVITMAINIGDTDPKTLPAYVKEYRR